MKSEDIQNGHSVWERAVRDADMAIELPGGVPMFFRRIPAGEFFMGSRGYYADEQPVHRVVLTHEFFLGTFVVTQLQYAAVARVSPSLRKRSTLRASSHPRQPVEQVHPEDALAYCNWLQQCPGLPKGITEVRLPTEAEWEYACRAGSATEYYNGDGVAALAEIAWFNENSGAMAHDVDRFPGEHPEEHPFGLFGMHGNVWEWCRDAWDPEAYRKRVDGAENPETLWTEASERRVLRGGSWGYSARGCRSARRIGLGTVGRYWDYGFRVCLQGSRDKAR